MLDENRSTISWTQRFEDGSFTAWVMDVPAEMARTFSPKSPFAGDMVAKWSEFIQPRKKHPYNKDGYLHGVEQAWYRNGTKSVNAPHEYGLRHGLIECWDENGNHTLKGICKNDKAIGLWLNVNDGEFGVDPERAHMTGPWFFFSDVQEEPIAWGETAEDVMEQQVVKDYLHSKGMEVAPLHGGLHVLRVDDKDRFIAPDLGQLMTGNLDMIQTQMDRADVPWFDIHAIQPADRTEVVSLFENTTDGSIEYDYKVTKKLAVVVEHWKNDTSLTTKDIREKLEGNPHAQLFQISPFNKEGIRHGLYKSWHENGVFRGEAPFDNGEVNGLWEAWRADGELETRGLTKNSEPIGLTFTNFAHAEPLWFFYTPEQLLPIAEGKTAEEVMDQQVVKDYLAERGFKVERHNSLLYTVKVDGDEPTYFAVEMDRLFTDSPVVRQIFMDRIDVPSVPEDNRIRSKDRVSSEPPVSMPEP